ncbi:MAG: AccI family restriction endonuclease [Bacteroidales bacterium]|nr:AccI family restriction endonuclease [Bacteroidales bacterium]
MERRRLLFYVTFDGGVAYLDIEKLYQQNAPNNSWDFVKKVDAILREELVQQNECHLI